VFTEAANTSSEGSVEIVESTHRQWSEGDTQFATFADAEGNSYRMEADYDLQGRLTEYRTFFNGVFVGRANPTWSGTDQTRSLASDADGNWIGTNADGELTAASWQSTGCENDYQWQVDCGVDGGGSIASAIPCDDEEAGGCSDTIQVACSNEISNYAWQSLGLVSGVAAVGAGALATEPAAPFALGSSVGFLAVQTRNWYVATRALDVCRKRNRPQAV
jgi:hypothetical protein